MLQFNISKFSKNPSRISDNFVNSLPYIFNCTKSVKLFSPNNSGKESSSFVPKPVKPKSRNLSFVNLFNLSPVKYGSLLLKLSSFKFIKFDIPDIFIAVNSLLSEISKTSKFGYLGKKLKFDILLVCKFNFSNLSLLVV